MGKPILADIRQRYECVFVCVMIPNLTSSVCAHLCKGVSLCGKCTMCNTLLGIYDPDLKKIYHLIVSLIIATQSIPEPSPPTDTIRKTPRYSELLSIVCAITN